MIGILLRLFGIGVGICFIVFGAASAFKSARRLNRRITEFKAEQEELQKQGRAMDPYMALMEVYAEDAPAPTGPPRAGRDARRAQRYDAERKAKPDA
jgi:hypothetical protein